MAQIFDIATAKSRFPALQQSQVFFDNAGGSQVLDTVITSVTEYLSNNNVQLGASYAVGRKSTEKYAAGYEAAAQYINASTDEIVMGASTTQLIRNLSYALSFPAGSELIVSLLDHEANIAPWVSLAAQQKLTIKWWKPKEESTHPKLLPEDLKELLTEKTVLVTCTHASNILGTIHDIKAIAEAVHSVPGAMLCVDAVSYAPHRRIDVRGLGVDFYAFSWYKVYGAHISMLYASTMAQEKMISLGHYFNPSSNLKHKLGLAGDNYELTQSIPAIVDYFGPDLDASFKKIEQHEEVLQRVLLAYLRGRSDVTIYGEVEASAKLRVSTIGFVIKGWASRDVVEIIDRETNFGCRWGTFYSVRLANDLLGLGDDGLVRVSMVHYNTLEEIKLYVQKLDELILPKNDA